MTARRPAPLRRVGARRPIRFPAAAIQAVLALTLLFAARGAWAATIKLTPQTFTLDNGLQVVVLPDHRAPVVTSMVWYRVGSADEQWGKSGLAHFLEHLMFKGTKTVPPGAFSQTIARNGGQDNAFTSSDYTAYYERVALDRLPLILKLEADRMVNLQLTDAVVAPELKVVLEERRMRTENNPSALFSDALSSALFMTHPYAIPVIGWRAETEKLSTADALAFYRAHYGPDNAILVLAGDVTEQGVRPLVEKYFGPLASRHIPPRHRATMPPQYVARQVIMHDARVRQPMWQRVYLAPSYRTAGKSGAAEALDLLEEILGTGSTSRLYRALVVEKGVAAGASADYLGTALDDTRFAITVVPRPGVTAEAAGDAADAVIAQVLAKGVSADELKTAKDRLIADELYRQDNQESLAMRFGSALATGQTVDDVVQWPERIKAVTQEQVLKAAQAVLRPERSVTGVLLPAPAS